tara:strand:- start:447 stop:1979 length:1533 start_codon:yes stop_codon:yes gene_type:complete
MNIFLQFSKKNKILRVGKHLFFSIQILLLFMSCSREDKIKKPNILFIAIDDLNDWIGSLDGKDGMFTPNLDKLSNKGILFSNAHCSAPACSPSRASVMSGVRPSTSGVYANQHDWRKSPVLKNSVTIPEYFQGKGYIVKGGGKLFHALSWIQTYYGIDQIDSTIWDDYFPSKIRQLPESIWPASHTIDSINTVRWNPIAAPYTDERPNYFFDYAPLGDEKNMADYKVVDWAIEELNKPHDKPLFLGVGIFRPHIPWFVPKKYFDLYPIESIKLPKLIENDLNDVPKFPHQWLRKSWQKWILDNDQWKYAVQGYMASISFSDAMLGRLIDGLNKSKISDNTIIILWSDHGMHIGEKEHWEKFTLWEESTRIPLIIYVPGLQPRNGNICREAVSLLDIYPTLVELIGDVPFKQLEGVSLLPQLIDPSLEREEPAVTTFHYNNHSVRTEDWRYISYNNGEEELYDHRKDPDEFHNIADKPESEQIKLELKRWLPTFNASEDKYIDSDKKKSGF